jgi:hypothetical protein
MARGNGFGERMTTEHFSTPLKKGDSTVGVTSSRTGDLSTEQRRGVIRDLQSRRRQLELQNEKLRRNQQGLEVARAAHRRWRLWR